MKFFQKPMNCSATSASFVTVLVPRLKPVVMGWSIQTMFVRFVHEYGF